MGEIAEAVETLRAPVRYAQQKLIADPIMNLNHFLIDFLMRYQVDSELGHALIKIVMNPSLTFVLNRFYDNREVMRLFGHIPSWMKVIIAGGATFANRPIITQPINQVVANVATIYCGIFYGPEARVDADMFFNIGAKVSGRIQGLDMGSGNSSDPINCFFKGSLRYGVYDVNDDAHEEVKSLDYAMKPLLGVTITVQGENAKMNKVLLGHSTSTSTDTRSSCDGDNNSGESKDDLGQYDNPQPENQHPHPRRMKAMMAGMKYPDTNVHVCEFTKERKLKNNKYKRRVNIAMSCLLFATLTYRTDEQLDACLKEGMLPGVKIYTVNTGDSGTSLIAFVDEVLKWAVFSYRGTQFEVVRQMLTSIDFTLETFDCGDASDEEGEEAHVRQVYMREVQKSCHLHTFRQKFENKGRLRPIELMRILAKRGFKLYLTGHSLGGGLATLLAAKVRRMNLPFDALVTFGATPVGDRKFVQWFDKAVDCSWRFVYGDEFAPLTPPIPFTQPSEAQKLMHVDTLIHFTPPLRKSPENAVEIEQMLGSFTLETGLVKTLADHNPMLTMRALRHFKFGSTERLQLPTKEEMLGKCHAPVKRLPPVM